METTMIQVKKETAKMLKEMKQYNRQSYDEIIKNMVNEARAERLTDKDMKDIEEALKDIKEGRVYKIEDVAKEFGIKLKE